MSYKQDNTELDREIARHSNRARRLAITRTSGKESCRAGEHHD